MTSDDKIFTLTTGAGNLDKDIILHRPSSLPLSATDPDMRAPVESVLEGTHGVGSIPAKALVDSPLRFPHL